MIDKLGNAPIYFAVIQAKFNAIRVMEQYVDQIQEMMRQDGFSTFDPQKNQMLEVKKEGEKVEGQVASVWQWHFSKSDRTSGYILSSDQITYRTTHYLSRNEFIEDFSRGLKIVDQVVKLDHVTRLGLRYLNAVIPKQGESVRQYLTSPLSSLEMDGERIGRASEAHFQTDLTTSTNRGFLLVRVYGSEKKLGYPPDMVPQGLVPKPEFIENEECNHASVDIDHSLTELCSLDHEKIKQTVTELHDILKLAFEKSVTDHALEVWK